MTHTSSNRNQNTHSPESGSPILRVVLGEDEIFTMYPDEAPIEKTPILLLDSPKSLHFLDSTGAVKSYDLTSVYDEGWRYLHCSIRVGPTFAVEADALLTQDGKNALQLFQSLLGKGIRLQPFYLPECSSSSAELIGRGLFFRGLHFYGNTTPSNVSLLCLCDHCNKSFRIQSFHAGFSNLTYLYCSKQAHTLVASSYLPDAPPVTGESDAEAVARFERKLPSCEECDGEFRYMNAYRCPHCQEPYIDFHKHPKERTIEYYGNYLYGKSPQRWEPTADEISVGDTGPKQ